MRCLDAYALVEIHNGNPLFIGLLNEEAVITDVTMAEFYGHLYKKHNAATADYWHRKLSFICKNVPRDTLIKATKFRIDRKEKNLSFSDCVGYVFAAENGMRFVTGDREFRQMQGVEFVK